MLLHLNIFFSLLISFSIVYFMIPIIIKIARMKNLVDVPNHRSAAKQIVPTLGGIAIYTGFRISQIISLDSYNVNELRYMSLAVLVMFIVGLKDDIVGVSARSKLAIQVAMAFYLVYFGNYYFTNLHGIFGIYQIDYVVGTLLSIIAIVGIINSINLIDGIDGLSSGIGILISVVFGILFLNNGDYIYAMTCFCLTGSLIAFFLYNVFGSSNKIFMGDTGSLILGTIVALLVIHFNEFTSAQNQNSVGLPAISLAIIIVPVIDTIRIFAIRLSQGKSPFTPDMNHIHHQMLRLTGNHLHSSLIIIAANALIIFLAFSLIDTIGNNNLFFLLLISGFILAAIPYWILKFKSRRSAEQSENKSIFAFFTFLKK